MILVMVREKRTQMTTCRRERPDFIPAESGLSWYSPGLSRAKGTDDVEQGVKRQLDRSGFSDEGVTSFVIPRTSPQSLRPQRRRLTVEVAMALQKVVISKNVGVSVVESYSGSSGDAPPDALFD
jgi:hypothetical protein